jgi:outer membrane protein assembly factor BamB
MQLARLIPALTLLTASALAQVDVTTQHNDNDRTGANLRETVLKRENVNSASFGLLAKFAVDDQVYSQPLVVTGVQVKDANFGTGTHDLVYVTTVNNSVYAFDANDPTATKPVWHVNFGAPANLYDARFGCLDINGSMGIIGTPVIDKARGALYVVALTRNGKGFTQRLHALDLATGADLDHSPVVIAAPAFDPLMQNQRPALLLANDTVYVGYASHCDKEPYHGFLLGYDATTLAQTAVLNTSPKGGQASIWQSGQGPAADADGNVYVVTGNGSWNGTTDFSESFLKLTPTLKLLDWFTPTNHFHLDEVDDDLDSSGATLIPGTTSVIGGGKEGVLYTLDTRGLGHLGDEHATGHFKATASHLHSLVYWESAKNGGLLYVWGQRDKERVYQVTDGKVAPTPLMLRPEANEGHPGAMLSLSANGKKEGILWAAIHASGDSWHETRPGILHAYDADNIDHELWNSWQNRGRDDCDGYSKMAPPTIANGQVYLASFGKENIGTGGLCI